MILVTGATGHIGKHLVNALVEDGEQVRALVNEEGIKIKNVEVVYGNILDKEAVKKAAEGAGVIYHLAAIVDYKPAPRDQLYSVNVIGTKNVPECSEGARVIYQSSTAVYGRVLKENPATETTPFNPHSYYGQTKIMAEKLVLQRNGIVLRSPVIYGPGFNEGYGFVLRQVKKGKMPIVGDGKNLIQWIHINDLIRAMLLVRKKGRPGEVYLVAGGEVKTQEELMALLAKDFGVDPPKKHVSKPLANLLAYYKMFSAKMKGKESLLVPEDISKMSANRTFDISKARKELGFEPSMTYEHGAKEMVEEYLKNKKGVQG